MRGRGVRSARIWFSIGKITQDPHSKRPRSPNTEVQYLMFLLTILRPVLEPALSQKTQSPPVSGVKLERIFFADLCRYSNTVPDLKVKLCTRSMDVQAAWADLRRAFAALLLGYQVCCKKCDKLRAQQWTMTEHISSKIIPLKQHHAHVFRNVQKNPNMVYYQIKYHVHTNKGKQFLQREPG